MCSGLRTNRVDSAASHMKQVTQRLRNGRIEVLDVPPPVVAPTGVLVDVRASLVSAGTERSTVDAARRGLVGKARARPEQARAVLEKARRDGIGQAIDAVRLRLDQPSPLGYSSAGVVLAAGARATGLRPGDRVACAGGGHAVHAELNYVPANLCTSLPEEVSFDAGAFVTVGSIALHGVRQADVRIGERVAVIGLGLIGQLTCRILHASGCEVVGVDLVPELVDRARRSGIATAFLRPQLDVRRIPADASHCDAVILTASTTSDDPIELAGALARDRARVVVLGDVGMTLPRTSYYGKELEVRLSRSYGPGRYDRAYEERGLDYPIGYVRWTEQRNLAAFAALLADRRVTVDDLITARVPIAEAEVAYDRLLNDSASPLGLVLTYEPSPASAPTPDTPPSSPRRSTDFPAVGVIGAGSFSQRVLIPALRDAGFGLSMVASASGLSAARAANRFGFGRTATPDEVIQADNLDLVCIASRHGSHARYAAEALRRGCAVFVEKPPALSLDELNALADAARGHLLQVGFNRRFAPLSIGMRQHVARPGQPIELLYRVAAGILPEDHWLNDPDEGGGRLLGEGCHFVDFACWLMGELPVRTTASVAGGRGHRSLGQRFSVTLEFDNGSLATILYSSESAAGIQKELIETHSTGWSAVIEDFRLLRLYGPGRTRIVRRRDQDKGHRAQFIALRHALDGHPLEGPDPLDTMAATIHALEQAST